jgi:hypothetical protein
VHEFQERIGIHYERETTVGTVIRRVVTWAVEPSGGLETAWIALDDGALTAHGRAVGKVPEPYWVTYQLATGPDQITQRVGVAVERASGTTTLELARDAAGKWTANGAVRQDLAGALDCDLGLCPLTNTMPILRHHLHRGPGKHELVMAWISVPDLAVRRNDQTYEHVRRVRDGAVVRYSSGHFTSEIEVDDDGIVVRYPQLAQRID